MREKKERSRCFVFANGEALGCKELICEGAWITIGIVIRGEAVVSLWYRCVCRSMKECREILVSVR